MYLSDEKVPSLSTNISRGRSNTVNGHPPSFARMQDSNPDAMDDGANRNPNHTARSPKLFINCLEIRKRSRSLSSNNSFGARSRVLPKTCASPESMMSSTFPPPRRDMFPQESNDEPSRSLPSKLTSNNNSGNHSDTSSDYSMESDDNEDEMMDSDDDMPFKMDNHRKKKRVNWADDENLVHVHTYQSDYRYYERNPFYGFGGKVEYGPED